MSSGQQNGNFTNSLSSKGISILTGDEGASDEGSYYIVTNPTPGTAIATTTSVVDDATGATTHAQQKPTMAITNSWGPSSGVLQQNLYLRYLKMFIVQVPTSATSWKYAMRLSPNSAKITTAGTACVPVSPNGNYAQASRAIVSFGAVTATDSASDPGQRLVANGQVSGAIPVALDEWLFTFGDGARSLDLVGTQTLVKRLTVPVGPIIIAPGWTWTLEMWGASNAAAPSWEFEMGYVERPTGQ